MNLKFDEQHYCTHSFHSGEQYGDWSADYVFEAPTRAWSVEKPVYGSYPYVGPEPKEADILYVIYAVWSSGDSFGSDSRGSYDIVCVNNDQKRAYENLRRLKEHNPKFSYSDGGNQVTVDLDDGSTMNVYTGSWKGYFESLDELEVAEVLFDADTGDLG